MSLRVFKSSLFWWFIWIIIFTWKDKTFWTHGVVGSWPDGHFFDSTPVLTEKSPVRADWWPSSMCCEVDMTQSKSWKLRPAPFPSICNAQFSVEPLRAPWGARTPQQRAPVTSEFLLENNLVQPSGVCCIFTQPFSAGVGWENSPSCGSPLSSKYSANFLPTNSTLLQEI